MYQLDDTAKSIFDLVKGGTAFDTSVLGSITSTQGSLATAVSQMQAAIASGNVTGPDATTLSNQLSQLQDFADSPEWGNLTSHMTDQFTNLPRNLNLYTSQVSLNQGIGEAPAFPPNAPEGDSTVTSICSGINSFFGSIMGEAQALLSSVGSAVSSVLSSAQNIISGTVGSAVSAISTALSAISTAIGSITTMISREVSAIAGALGDMLGLSDALSIKNLINHPCAKTVLGAAAGGGLAAILTGAI